MSTTDIITLVGIISTLLISIWNLYISFSQNKKTLFVNAVTAERVRWIGEVKELFSEYLSLIIIYDDKLLLEGIDMNNYFERLIYLQHKIKLHLNYKAEEDKEIVELVENINKKIFGIYEANKVLKVEPNKRFEHFSKKTRDELLKGFFESKNININNSSTEELLDIYGDFIDYVNSYFRNEYGYKGESELQKITNELVTKVRVYTKSEWERVKRESQKGGNYKKIVWKKSK